MTFGLSGDRGSPLHVCPIPCRLTRIFGTAVLVLMGGACWTGGPVITPRLVRQVTPGMAAADVERRLGSPGADSSDRNWIHRQFGNPGWVAIEFDEQERVLEVNDESPIPFP